jgi:hypothetical protein
MVLVMEVDAGRLEHPLPLPAGLDPLAYLAAVAKHLPALRAPTARAWCQPPETRRERDARLRSTSPTPKPLAAAAAPSA